VPVPPKILRYYYRQNVLLPSFLITLNAKKKKQKQRNSIKANPQRKENSENP
jgi:hypothetical protein